MIGTRSSWAIGLWIALGLLGIGGVYAGEPTPEGVLKSRGLTLSGKLFVLEKEEAEFLRKLDEISPIYNRLRVRAIQLDKVVQHGAEFNELDNQRILTLEILRNLEADMAVMPRDGDNFKRQAFLQAQDYQKFLKKQLIEMDRVLGLERKNLVDPGKKQVMFDEYTNKRSEFLSASRDVRPLGDRTEKAYAELAKDATIKKALNDYHRSSKPSVNLGPSPNFRNGMSQLKDAERTLKPATDTSRTRTKDKRKKAPEGKVDMGSGVGGKGVGSE